MKQPFYFLSLSYTVGMLSLGGCTAGYSNNCDGLDGELREAVENNNPAGVKASLEKGADPKATCKKHPFPALHRAAALGSLKMVEVLLKGGVPVDSKNINGTTPLHRAASLGHTAVARLLLKRGAQVDSQTKYNGYTPLHEAVRDRWEIRSISLLKLLIDEPQDLHLKDDEGQTALAMAEKWFKKAAEYKYKDEKGKKYYSLAIAMLKQKMRP